MKIQEKIDLFFKETKTCPSDWYVSPFDYGTPEQVVASKPKYQLYDLEKNSCNLCETKIIHEFYINHDGKKMSALVGSDCIKKFLTGPEGLVFARDLKKVTLKESTRKLKIRMYDTLVAELTDFFHAYREALHKGMPEPSEYWHKLVQAMAEAKLSECKNFASVWHYRNLKELNYFVEKAKAQPYFEILTPEAWWKENFEVKPKIDLSYLTTAVKNSVEYCKTTDDPIKLFAVNYSYRFSRARKECPAKSYPDWKTRKQELKEQKKQIKHSSQEEESSWLQEDQKMVKNYWDILLASAPIDLKAAMVSDFENGKLEPGYEGCQIREKLNKIITKNILSLSKIRRAAKLLKKLHPEIMYTKLLDLVAMQQGYKNFSNAYRHLATAKEIVEKKQKKEKLKKRKELKNGRRKCD